MGYVTNIEQNEFSPGLIDTEIDEHFSLGNQDTKSNSSFTASNNWVAILLDHFEMRKM